jgi:cupin 2 domain-containing protein
MTNIFAYPNLDNLADRLTDEHFEVLAAGKDVRIERIISTGQTTPGGEWYDQTQDEWVILLQGEAKLAYEDGSTRALKPGDYVFIPAHQKHRVDYTSVEPPCVWLAIHADLDATPSNLDITL